jgi:hypothetical protein
MSEYKELYFYPTPVGNQKRTTIAAVIDDENGVLRIGKSLCSHKDMFNKKKGRAIALGRATCKHKPSEDTIKKGLAPIEVALDTTITPIQQFIALAKTI